MPLRDHFNPPLSDRRSWDALHGGRPMMIAMDLNRRLPAAYVASPQIHLGANFEIDVVTSANDPSESDLGGRDSDGGATTAVWAPPMPTLPELDEYEVRIVETEGGRLVAAIEIVSPANKDRPEHRRAFVAKCAALLQQGVSVSIIDLVTTPAARSTPWPPRRYADTPDASRPPCRAARGEECLSRDVP